MNSLRLGSLLFALCWSPLAFASEAAAPAPQTAETPSFAPIVGPVSLTRPESALGPTPAKKKQVPQKEKAVLKKEPQKWPDACRVVTVREDFENQLYLDEDEEDELREETVRTFDPFGNELRVAFGPEGSTYVRTHDVFGKVVQSDSLNKDGSVFQTVRWKYDSFGNAIEHVAYDGAKTVMTYDQRGSLLMSRSMRPNGELSSSTTFVNDTAGNPVEKRIQATWNKSGPTKITNFYDKAGRLVYQEEKTENGNPPWRRMAWFFDEEGRLVEHLSDNPSQKVRNSHRYDAQGNRIFSGWDEGRDGTWDSETRWTYDAHGNPLTKEVRRLNKYKETERDSTTYDYSCFLDGSKKAVKEAVKGPVKEPVKETVKEAAR